jgi:hypothetical protein
MPRPWLAFVMVVAGCMDDPNSLRAYAPDPVYHEEISLCREQAACELLCTRLFEVRVDEIAACEITSVDDGGANVRLELYVEDWGWSDDAW